MTADPWRAILRGEDGRRSELVPFPAAQDRRVPASNGSSAARPATGGAP